MIEFLGRVNFLVKLRPWEGRGQTEDGDSKGKGERGCEGMMNKRARIPGEGGRKRPTEKGSTTGGQTATEGGKEGGGQGANGDVPNQATSVGLFKNKQE